MDLKLLADTLTIALAPALPFLVSGGEELIRQAGKKLGEEGLELAKKLWGRLWPKIEESPEAQSSARVAAKAPGDEDARAGLRFQLREILAADPELAAELAELLATSGAGASHKAVVLGSGAVAQGAGAVAAGEGGIAVGGDVHGGLSAGRAKGPAAKE